MSIECPIDKHLCKRSACYLAKQSHNDTSCITSASETARLIESINKNNLTSRESRDTEYVKFLIVSAAYRFGIHPGKFAVSVIMSIKLEDKQTEVSNSL